MSDNKQTGSEDKNLAGFDNKGATQNETQKKSENSQTTESPSKQENTDANFGNTDEDLVAQKPNLTTVSGGNLTGLQSNNAGTNKQPAEESKQTAENKNTPNPFSGGGNDSWSKISNPNPYQGFGNSYPMDDNYTGVPEICDVDTAVESIISKSNIVVFTGPGISSGSLIPDFKRDQPFWTLKNGQDKIELKQLLTKKFFFEKPEEVWRWHHQFRKLVVNSAPNDAHYTLADLHNQCREIGITFHLITENIDSFHVDSYIRSESKSKKNYFEETKGGGMATDEDSENYGFCKDVYEINGNINYMRCAKGCCKKLFPSPLGCAEYFVPSCPECKGLARPHTKFYDEEYDNFFHKYSEVQEKCVYPDCIILVGADLECEAASSLVTQAMSSGALIVEVGSVPCVEFGNVKQLVGFTEELVPLLCKTIREKLSKLMPSFQ